MGKLIRFPKNSKLIKKSSNEPLVNRISELYSDDTSQVRFTCGACNTTSKFTFSAATFKELSFYCGSCGIGYKLKNPIFNQKKDSGSQ